MQDKHPFINLVTLFLVRLFSSDSVFVRLQPAPTLNMQNSPGMVSSFVYIHMQIKGGSSLSKCLIFSVSSLTAA